MPNRMIGPLSPTSMPDSAGQPVSTISPVASLNASVWLHRFGYFVVLAPPPGTLTVTPGAVPVTLRTLGAVPVTLGTPGAVPVTLGTLGAVPVTLGTLGAVPVTLGTLGAVPVTLGTLGAVPVTLGTLGAVSVTLGTLGAVPVTPGVVTVTPGVTGDFGTIVFASGDTDCPKAVDARVWPRGRRARGKISTCDPPIKRN